MTIDAEGSLLSNATARNLIIIQLVNTVLNPVQSYVQKITEEYDSIFHGLRKLKDF